MVSIIVHGGCGDEKIEKEKMDLMKKGVKKACEQGFAGLKEGGTAVDIIEKILVSMEDNPVFDAGTGSFYNLLGEIEMDASLMKGSGEAGAVAGIAALSAVAGTVAVPGVGVAGATLCS